MVVAAGGRDGTQDGFGEKSVSRGIRFKIEPRGLSREAAIEYLGIEATRFDALVEVGALPRPILFLGKIWDRHALDAYRGRRLPVIGGDEYARIVVEAEKRAIRNAPGNEWMSAQDNDLGTRWCRVYFIRGGGLVKIGYSECPTSRMADLQAGSPIKLELLGTIRGQRGTEEALHKKFSHLRKHGEWFRLTKEIQAFIDTHCQSPANDNAESHASAA